jgi:hypothetical protein
MLISMIVKLIAISTDVHIILFHNIPRRNTVQKLNPLKDILPDEKVLTAQLLVRHLSLST